MLELAVIPLVALSSLVVVGPARAQGATIPAVSPDGQWLAFGSTRSGKSQIYVMNLETGSVRRVTHDSAADRHPTWSPDGTRVAYQSYFNGASSVWVVDASGGTPRRVTPAGASAVAPAWSPDGRWLAVAQGTMMDLDLWLYPTDGAGSPVQVTRGPEYDYWPAWSPDGARLAFVQDVFHAGTGMHRHMDTTRSGIAVVSRDGTGGRLVIVDTNGVHEAPAFSPDGSRIVFQSRRGSGSGFDLWTMRPDGSDVRPLRVAATFDEAPVWGTHPQRIFYESQRAHHAPFEIWAVDPDGGHPMRIVER